MGVPLVNILVFIYTIYGFLTVSLKIYKFVKLLKNFKRYCNNVIYVFNAVTTSKYSAGVEYYSETESECSDKGYDCVGQNFQECIPDTVNRHY